MSLTWRYVFTTRRELDTESETIDATKPMKARRSNQTIMGCFAGSGMFSVRKLYYHVIRIFTHGVKDEKGELTVANQG